MSVIYQTLNKEKELNNLLGNDNLPCDLKDQFNNLFNSEIYQKTATWLNKDKDKKVYLHDTLVLDYSQKKHFNTYNISFKLTAHIYEQDQNVGVIKGCEFKITTLECLRAITSSDIANFLIDEQNKEIGFLFLKNNKRQVIKINYEKIEFLRGQEFLFSKKRLKI